MRIHILHILLLIILLSPASAANSSADDQRQHHCIPLTAANTLTIKVIPSSSANGTEYNLLVSAADDFRGRLRLNKDYIKKEGLSVTVTTDSNRRLTPVMDGNGRSCRFIPAFPYSEDRCIVSIPAGFFEVEPLEYIEVEEIDIDPDSLSQLSVAGAWHKTGGSWNGRGMFSIIDDDSIDGQIKSSSQSGSYGYFSLLYPLLESLGLKGNLAVEGRRTGLSTTPPEPNDNLKTIVRLQDEKGWDILSHSMMCLGEILNNWMVDSLNSQLAKELLASGPKHGTNAATISIYDRRTERQYWPDSTGTRWIETPQPYIKPYIGDYKTGEAVMYNPDFDVDWHWGEWKRRAEEFGVEPKGYVTHNSTSSQALVSGIMNYFPHGFSDLSIKNINTVPLLSSAVRAGLEGQSLKGYKGESPDNTFNTRHFNAFCSQIDETAETGGWIVFNLHTYRDCWRNSLPGSLISEGGTYPDEWVIPLKGVDPVKDSLNPPESLGISEWSEWYPCPGTRLRMMWEVLRYAKQKGLLNVTSSEGFGIIGNKRAAGYFNNGYAFGMDIKGIRSTREIYPHYLVSATDETFYFNPLITEEIEYDLADYISSAEWYSRGKFFRNGSFLAWEGPDFSEIQLKAFDMAGREIFSSDNNLIDLNHYIKGPYIVIAFKGKARVAGIKILK